MKCNVIFALLLYSTHSYCRHIPENGSQSVPQEKLQAKAGSSNKMGGQVATTCDDTKNCDRETVPMPPRLPKLSDVVEHQALMGRAPYYVNQDANTGSLGVGVGYHGGIIYPYAHPDLLAASYPFSPVQTLPAVYTPQVPNYTPYLNPLSPMSPYALPRTPRRSDFEQEILEELDHDAMMPNILPTMEIPIGRAYVNPDVYAMGGVTAVFPGHVGGCGLPILLSCSPNIVRGTLGRPVPGNEIIKNKQENVPAKLEVGGGKKKVNPETRVLPEVPLGDVAQ